MSRQGHVLDVVGSTGILYKRKINGEERRRLERCCRSIINIGSWRPEIAIGGFCEIGDLNPMDRGVSLSRPK
jgi:hypothetical protein